MALTASLPSRDTKGQTGNPQVASGAGLKSFRSVDRHPGGRQERGAGPVPRVI